MDLIALFKSLFGAYSPIQNVVSEVDGVVTYSYSIDWSIITHYAMILIIFWAICKCITLFILNLSKGVALK